MQEQSVLMLEYHSKKIVMKIIKFNILFVTALVVTLLSCDNVDFGDINVDPNSPSNASTAALLTNAQLSVSGQIASTTPNLYVQYLSNGQYDEESRYQTLNWSYDGFYAAITDLDKIIELNTNEDTKVAAQANGTNNNQIAVASILRVYFFHIMTDRWGMIPYTEALKGLENQYPAFDSQQTIYSGLFQELDAAVAKIEDGGIVGDVMLDGNMNSWRTFANTIKLIMAMRLSNADPTMGQQKFNEALDAGVISSNDENVKYNYLTDNNNDNPWQDRFETRRDYLVSKIFVDALIGTGTNTTPEDPRLPKMAELAESSFTYEGAPYGTPNTNVTDYSNPTSNIIFKGDAPLYVYTLSEVLFARAEAAEMGWTGEDPSILFSMAIMASMEQWGVDPVDAAIYSANHPYNGLTDIGYQKWVALFLQGYNSWASWRRQKAMGYGMNLTAPANLLSNATGIPDRQAYGATAASLNETNYNQAISTQGPDALNTVLWLFH